MEFTFPTVRFIVAIIALYAMLFPILHRKVIQPNVGKDMRCRKQNYVTIWSYFKYLEACQTAVLLAVVNSDIFAYFVSCVQ